MTAGTLLSIGLLLWFVALAFAELRFDRRAEKASASDARLFTNFGLAVTILTIGSVWPARLGASLLGKYFGLGLAYRVGLPWLVVLALALVGQSLASYGVHRLMHRLPLLWRVHRVHHTDQLVDVSTSFRNHPLELLLTSPVDVMVILLLGVPVPVVLATQTIFFAITIWSHADVDLPPSLDRVLAFVVITPRLHRLHHHPDRRLHDTNFSDSFTLWDRLLGTFSDCPDRKGVGLASYVGRADHFLDMIVSPIRAA